MARRARANVYFSQRAAVIGGARLSKPQQPRAAFTLLVEALPYDDNYATPHLFGDCFRQRNILSAGVLFGRDTGRSGRSYGDHDMIHVLDIDPRIARRCLHAGRLQAGA